MFSNRFIRDAKKWVVTVWWLIMSFLTPSVFAFASNISLLSRSAFESSVFFSNTLSFQYKIMVNSIYLCFIDKMTSLLQMNHITNRKTSFLLYSILLKFPRILYFEIKVVLEDYLAKLHVIMVAWNYDSFDGFHPW